MTPYIIITSVDQQMEREVRVVLENNFVVVGYFEDHQREEGDNWVTINKSTGVVHGEIKGYEIYSDESVVDLDDDDVGNGTV